jgi:hypothetical protein
MKFYNAGSGSGELPTGRMWGNRVFCYEEEKKTSKRGLEGDDYI